MYAFCVNPFCPVQLVFSGEENPEAVARDLNVDNVRSTSCSRSMLKRSHTILPACDWSMLSGDLDPG